MFCRSVVLSLSTLSIWTGLFEAVSQQQLGTTGPMKWLWCVLLLAYIVVIATVDILVPFTLLMALSIAHHGVCVIFTYSYFMRFIYCIYVYPQASASMSQAFNAIIIVVVVVVFAMFTYVSFPSGLVKHIRLIWRLISALRFNELRMAAEIDSLSFLLPFSPCLPLSV